MPSEPAPVERGTPLLDEGDRLCRVFDAADPAEARGQFFPQDLADLGAEALDIVAVMHQHKLKDTDDYCTCSAEES